MIQIWMHDKQTSHPLIRIVEKEMNFLISILLLRTCCSWEILWGNMLLRVDFMGKHGSNSLDWTFFSAFTVLTVAVHLFLMEEQRLCAVILVLPFFVKIQDRMELFPIFLCFDLVQGHVCIWSYYLAPYWLFQLPLRVFCRNHSWNKCLILW